MLPNYALFSEVCDFGDVKVLQSALELVWSSSAGHLQKVDFEKQLDKVEQVTPRFDDFDSFGVRPAADACVGLTMLLEVCAGQQPLDLASLERLYLSTIDAYLELLDLPADAEEHPLEIDAKTFFKALREQLEASECSRSDLVKGQKQFARELGVSNIGIDITLD